jgi:cysteinyl-tRNA synthetase
LNAKTLNTVHNSFLELGKTLGIFLKKRTKEIRSQLADDLVQLLFDLRDELRKKGEYDLSDEIRSKLKVLGLVIEDTEEGSKWKLR